jgi:phosphoribosylformylglycinamidine cyclo-ligase
MADAVPVSGGGNGGDGGGLSYRDAGVDRDVAGRAKARIAELVRATFSDDVLSRPGGFGGLFRVPTGVQRPVLVASADGVGTKLKVAMMTGVHHTIGADLVNHCVNDILVEGARPLFFLDYIGMGVLEAGTVQQIVGGLADACRANGCALLGGETAEMPDFYDPGEYDLAGFIVGVVEEGKGPGAHQVEKGNALIGVASDGFHTNGYSLLRRLLFDRLGLGARDLFPDSDRSVGEVLLRPHRSYLKPLLPHITSGRIRALSHITGGGIPENLARVVPEGLSARVDRSGWAWPAEFTAVMKHGGVDEMEMYHTFNNGVGMILIAAEGDADALIGELSAAGERAWRIGAVEAGAERVVLA